MEDPLLYYTRRGFAIQEVVLARGFAIQPIAITYCNGRPVVVLY